MVAQKQGTPRVKNKKYFRSFEVVLVLAFNDLNAKSWISTGG